MIFAGSRSRGRVDHGLRLLQAHDRAAQMVLQPHPDERLLDRNKRPEGGEWSKPNFNPENNPLQNGVKCWPLKGYTPDKTLKENQESLPEVPTLTPTETDEKHENGKLPEHTGLSGGFCRTVRWLPDCPVACTRLSGGNAHSSPFHRTVR